MGDLTQAGETLLKHAQAVVARIEAARADLEALERGSSLRVGVCETAETRVVQALLKAQPGASIMPSTARDEAELVERIKRGSVELSLVTLPLPPGPLAFTRLDEPYVLLVPARSGLADRPALPPQDSVSLVGRPQSSQSAQVQKALKAAGWHFEPVGYACTDSAAEALVFSGVAAAILPRSNVDITDRATVAIELGQTFSPRGLALAWHRYRRLPPIAQRFRQAAVEACAALQYQVE